MKSARRLTLGTALLAGACRFGFDAVTEGQGAQHGGTDGNAGASSVGGGTGTASSSGAGGSGAGGNGAGGPAVAAAGEGGTGSLCGDRILQADEECEASLAEPEDLCRSDCTLDWYDRSFAKRRRITLDTATLPSTLTAFVVPIPLSPSELDYASLQPGGQDLRFVAADNTSLLSYEIENFAVGGASLVWVRFPSLAAGATASLWMYYGSPNANAGEAPDQTWSADFAAVYHLNGDARDSAANHDGAVTGAQVGSGQLAAALDFDGSDAVADAGSRAGVDDLFATGASLSAWIHPRAWGEGLFGRIADKASDTLSTTGWALQVDGGTSPNHTIIFEHGFSAGLGRWNGPDQAVPLDTWTHVAIVYDGSTASSAPVLYLNGAQEPLLELNTPAGARASDAGNRLGIGDQVVSRTRSFQGLIDELRLERIARNSDWIQAAYRSSLPGFLSFGIEQAQL